MSEYRLVRCPVCLREVPGWYDPDTDEENPYRHLRRVHDPKPTLFNRTDCPDANWPSRH